MDTHRFFVEEMRFHLSEADTLVFVGWFYDGATKDHTLTAVFDGKELPVVKLVNKGAEVRQKYIRSVNEIQEEVVGIVSLPPYWREGHRFSIHTTYRGKSSRDVVFSVKKLRKLEHDIHYYIENSRREEGKIAVSGWCMGGGEVKLSLLDGKKQPLPVKIDHYYRKDLMGIYPECEKDAKPGFLVQAEGIADREKKFYLEMRGAKNCTCTRIKKWDGGSRTSDAAKAAGDAMRYLNRNGLTATIRKIHTKLNKKQPNTYENWRKKYMVTEEELAGQRKRQKDFAFRPKFSVVVPMYKTKPAFLRDMIESLQSQTYPDWELCLADGSREEEVLRELSAIVAGYQKNDGRVRYSTLIQNAGIAGNTNAAIKMATGDYIVLMDHDDILSPDALYEFARALNGQPDIDVLYSDEDKVDMEGKKYFEPHFKPDFNIDLLCSVNYICHLFAVKRSILERVGGLSGEYDGAQDHDFILRCCEQAQKICHVPRILYHWRCHRDSTAANPESKLYAYEAGRRAVEAHYRRIGVPAVVENAQFYGLYRTRYQWEAEPLVSIIIPNMDHVDDLSKCLNAIYKKSDYRRFEIIVVENNSTRQETFAYYRELQAVHNNLTVLTYEGEFNFSKINNFGAEAAAGEYLLLLNNDTEMIDGCCIREMLGCCMRDDVGIVGAKLLYEDGSIQHAGVVLGFGGTAGHAFIGKQRFDTGYMGRILCAQDYSAVTAACMMVKRSVFEAVGGFTEELGVAFNDIDFCLKVRAMGKLVVYNPYAELFHYESKSRGLEDSPEKVERFNREIELLLSRWRTVIEDGDIYYNRNLTLDNSDFSLRR